MNDYQNLIALSRYARWLPDQNRRETWEETVNRLISFWHNKVTKKQHEVLGPVLEECRIAIHNLSVMPSMRSLLVAGPALERCNVSGFNCAYLVADSPRSFDEAFYLLLSGTGVGFSVEEKNTSKLPIVSEHFEKTDTVIVVQDSKAGWCRSFKELVSLLYTGQIPTWDLSRLRPAGAKLKTFGGRSSGPGPLNQLFEFTVELFKKASGRKLTPLEVHDVFCKIGEVVVVGGVRRSAMISLSDLNNKEMANAKTGAWWERDVQRALSNNSAVYEKRPTTGEFLSEWTSLYLSQSGERGIFNRDATRRIVARNGRRDVDHDWGGNPCLEILLRPFEKCNLTEVVVRPHDTRETLEDKVRIAAILGTLQSTLTDFKYLRKIWKQNAEEERLLGVSLTGILDHPTLIRDKELLEYLKNIVIETNKTYAEILGIPQSTATTCVKPSGTVSQLVDSASGLHPRWAKYYIRSIRMGRKDPLTQLMIDHGIPNEPDVTKPNDTVVFYFPQKAPEGSTTREHLTAIEHLEIWKTLQEYWCEHKPSVTINVREDEWIEVGAWVYKNFDILSGVSFLPYSEHTYRQAPYQECTEEEYLEAVLKMPESIDWKKLSEYELEDTTTGVQEYACVGNSCEII